MTEDVTTTSAPARKTGSYEPATAEFEVWIEHPDAFSQEHLQQLSKLELIKLVKVLREVVTQQEAKIACITEIGSALGTALQLDELLAVVMDKVTSLMEAERSTLFLVDGSHGELWSKVTQGILNQEIRLKVGQGIAGWVAQTGKSINIRDAYNDPRFNPEVDAKTGYQTRSILCQPIRNQEGRTLGVIQVLNRRTGHFTPEDENLLSALCAQIAIAIENSTLYLSIVEKNLELTELTRKLEHRVAELDLLAEIDRELSQTVDLESFIESTTQKMAEVFDARAAVLSLVETSHLRAYFHVFPDGEEPRFYVRNVDADEGICAHVVNTGQPILVNMQKRSVRQSSPPELPPKIVGLGEMSPQLGMVVHNVLAVPLFDEGDRAIGAIEIVNHSDLARGFTRDELKVLNLIASRIAGAVVARRHHEEMEKANRLATIGQMLSGVVHDLKNPIAIINGYVQLMARSDDREKRDEYADTIKRQFEALGQMTRELLDFARGQSTLLRRKVFVPNFFEELSELLDKELGPKGVELVLDLQYREEVHIDAGKFQRLILNLSRNACDSMPGGGTFTIRSRLEGDDVCFDFADTGSGIPEDIRDRLFEEFVTRGKEHGTGLGLAIVKKIVEEHEGTISFQSTLNEGTTFTVRIPRYPSS